MPHNTEEKRVLREIFEHQGFTPQNNNELHAEIRKLREKLSSVARELAVLREQTKVLGGNLNGNAAIFTLGKIANVLKEEIRVCLANDLSRKFTEENEHFLDY